MKKCSQTNLNSQKMDGNASNINMENIMTYQ